MQVNVLLTAFLSTQGVFDMRTVEVPHEEWEALQDQKLLQLDLIYRLGQLRSESSITIDIGDIIEIQRQHELYLVAPIGFVPISSENCDALLEMDLIERKAWLLKYWSENGRVT